MNSGYRVSGGRSKVRRPRTKKSSSSLGGGSGNANNAIQNLNNEFQQELNSNDLVIEEGIDEVSESMEVPMTPSPKTNYYQDKYQNKGYGIETKFNTFNSNSSQQTTCTHTRNNSSKAQSLKGSIVIQKPQVSTFFQNSSNVIAAAAVA